MRRRFWATLVLLAGAFAAAAAQPSIKAPAKVTGAVGEFVTVQVETEGPAVQFVALDAGLNVFPANLLANPKATVVTAAKPGSYRLLAYTGSEKGPSKP